jgi:circadian clock protein KaiB
MSEEHDFLIDRSAAFERALGERDTEHYLLRLYVAGLSPRSQQAIANLKMVCEEHLEGRYELEVIDIYRSPALAADEQIIAVPTLLKVLPAPLRKVIGDLSDKEKLLFGLDLKPKRPAGN